MTREESVIRFEGVSFEYGHDKPILDDASFAVRRGMKLAIMGANGAGKSTIFALMTARLAPESGHVHRSHGLTVATALQVIPREELELTVEAFFEKRFDTKVYDIAPKIDAVLGAVHLSAPHDRLVRSFSGGQQARLLLASALIQKPDLLLLDEPTNHINFRHLPVIASALDRYEGALILVSHVPEFVAQIRIDEVIDLAA